MFGDEGPPSYGSGCRAGSLLGTVTFLFTDIEDSTRLWEEAPTDMADALRIHDAIVRGTIERHGGYVFGTGGDGFCAAFSTAADAVTAAIESQEQLRDEAVVSFLVRMGLHTGEAVERDRNYFGSEVNRAARLMSLAHGGQILVSDATEVLLRNRVALRPLGEHRLRGLRGRMSVYQVIADGLPAEFPVLRSVDYFAGNLPQQLSSLVGREKVVAEVAELVRSSRLVTLTGVGGVGKTRLALEVGAEVAGEFPDGVWMVELASVGDPASVPAAIATVLGITPQGDAPLIDTVADALGGRQLLLVVDNCEHVLAAAGSAIAAILGRTRNVKVLATSRETLAVDGETVLAVAPLALDGGATSDAVALFVDRARAVRPDFGLREPETAAAVTEICETLDGLPLGIELAAARMAAMSAVEVRDRLADRFRLLKGSTPGPERQLTLRHAVEWSYDLLADDERDLLRPDVGLRRRLRPDEHLRGGRRRRRRRRRSGISTRWSESRSSSPTTARPAPDTASSRRSASSPRTGWRRRARSSGARDRHAEYFARESATRWERWNGPGWRDAVDWVEAELGNLRSGYQWSARRGDLEVATDIAAHAALMGFSVQLFETLAWAEELLEPASAADVRRLPRLYTAAGYACFAGRAEAARANAHRATELEVDSRYDACEPGYASFIEALGGVYCGDLDRYVELTGAVARAVRKRSRLWPGRLRRRPPVVRPDRGGARARRGIRRRREIARQPVLDLLRALDRRDGVLQGGRAPRVRGLGRGRRLRA